MEQPLYEFVLLLQGQDIILATARKLYLITG
jgi:hypothetical protein